ncbi:hypothetical protein HYZ41_02685 [archaeon]|nr:hypothetical protein [archaeon]
MEIEKWWNKLDEEEKKELRHDTAKYIGTGIAILLTAGILELSSYIEKKYNEIYRLKHDKQEYVEPDIRAR